MSANHPHPHPHPHPRHEELSASSDVAPSSSSTTTTTNNNNNNNNNNVVEALCQNLPPGSSSSSSSSSSIVMPAEWTPHRACLILFPHNPQTYRLDPAQKQVWNVALAIANEGNETVYLLVKDEDTLQKVLQKQQQQQNNNNNNNDDDDDESKNHNIQVRVCPSDDTWVRDTGPTCCFLLEDKKKKNNNNNNNNDKALIGIDWDFNGYGGPEEGCYWPCELDRKVASRVCQDILQIPSVSVPMILEGGSIHTDGEGTLLVTKECLLNPNRNPHLRQEDIEGVLKRTLGVEVVIWLPDGLDADEDTNGHIDNFCCFTEPGHVVLAWTDDEVNDLANYQRCRTALEVLSSCKDAQGRIIQVHKLPVPSPPLRYTKEEAESLENSDPAGVTRQPEEKMAASYVNFYIANEAVIVPQFGVSPTDAQAISVLQERFPGRKVVGVQSREILLGGGNIHCITQQIPLGGSAAAP